MKFTTKRTIKGALETFLVIAAISICGVSFSSDAGEVKNLDIPTAELLGTLIQMSEETYYRCDDEEMLHIQIDFEYLRDQYNMSSGAAHAYRVGVSKIEKSFKREYYVDPHSFCLTYTQYLRQISVTLLPEMTKDDLSVEGMKAKRAKKEQEFQDKRKTWQEERDAERAAQEKENKLFEKKMTQCANSLQFRRTNMDECLQVCSEHYSMWCEELSQDKRQLEQSKDIREGNGVNQIAEGIKSLF